MRRILAGILVIGLAGGVVSVAADEAAASTATGPSSRVSGPSPFGECRRSGADSQFPEGAFEPSAVVNPQNPSNVAVVWSQDRFRGLVAGVSFDGGASWRRVVIPGFTRCTGGRFGYVDDAWLSFGPDGVLHAYGKIFDASLTPSGAFAAHSTDGGLSWSDPTRLVLETDPGAGNYSGGEITADPFDGDYVYAVTPKFSEPGDGTEEFRGTAYFTRSRDGGHTWSTPDKIVDLGGGRFTTGHQTVVLPDGTLVGVFTIVDFRADPKDPETRLAVVHSADRGRSWSGPRVVAQLNSGGVRDPESGDRVAGSSRLLSDVAVDPVTGQIYLVWQDARFTGGRADAIAMSSSADGGRTWTAPARVNAALPDIPIGDQQAFTPAVAVTNAGTVAVGYYDFRRNSTRATLRTDRWLVRCTPSGQDSCTASEDFQDEVRLTAASFDMRQAKWLPATRSLDLSGYVGLTAVGPDFLAVFPVTVPSEPSRILSRRVSARLDVPGVQSTRSAPARSRRPSEAGARR